MARNIVPVSIKVILSPRIATPLQTPERSHVAMETLDKQPVCSHLFSDMSTNLERCRRGVLIARCPETWGTLFLRSQAPLMAWWDWGLCWLKAFSRMGWSRPLPSTETDRYLPSPQGLTAYHDISLDKCYVIELNTTIVLPPRNFWELLMNVKVGSVLSPPVPAPEEAKPKEGVWDIIPVPGGLLLHHSLRTSPESYLLSLSPECQVRLP